MRPYPFVMHRRILASCSFVANVRCATDLARGSRARRDGNRMEGAMFSTRVSRRTLLKTGAIAVLAARNLSSPVRQPGVQITEVAPPSSPAG